MNILFLTIAWPKQGARNLYTDLMDEFVNQGNRVYVVGARNESSRQKFVMEEENGINVIRISSGQIRKAAYFRKAITLLTLNRSLYRALDYCLNDSKIDLVIGNAPPITFSTLLRRIKRRYKAPVYLLLKDIWPQGSVDLKVFHKHCIIWSYLRIHEKRTYKTVDYIGVMSPLNQEYISHNNRSLSANRIEVCPNSIRPSLNTGDSEEAGIRTKYGIPIDACVFLFSGNLAKGHGLSFLVDAIKSLSTYHNAFFVLGGSGTHLKYLKDTFGTYNGNNILVYEWLPQKDFEMMLRTSDVGLILLDKRFTIPQFPSRLLSYLDSRMPVLCAVNESTDIGSIVRESNCGRTVIHGDLDSFIQEIKFLSENASIRSVMGENSKKLLEDNYTVERSYKIIMKHFENNTNGSLEILT